MLHTLVTYRTDSGREIEGTREHAAIVTKMHDSTPGAEIVSLTVFPHSKHSQFKHFIKRGEFSHEREHFEPFDGAEAANAVQGYALMSIVEDIGRKVEALEALAEGRDLSPVTPVAPVEPIKRKAGRPPKQEAA